MKTNYKKLHRKVKCPDCGIKVSKAKLAFHRLRKHGVKSGNYLKGLPFKEEQNNVSAPNAPWDNHTSKESAYKGGFNEGLIAQSTRAEKILEDAEIKCETQRHNMREQAIKLMSQVGQTIDAVNKLIQSCNG